MNVRTLTNLLADHRDAALEIELPSGEAVPAHFHITEVGRVEKSFIDCGGTKRELVSCLLQVWIAHDTDHRLTSGKLGKILAIAAVHFDLDALPVEFEYGDVVAAQYSLAALDVQAQRLIFRLAAKKTDCLARDKCGASACDTSDCCQ